MGSWKSGYQTIPYDIALSLPKNYNQINLKNELLPLCDSAGDRKIDDTFHEYSSIRIGDNHDGYIGFRDAVNNSNLLDDGAIDIVVHN